MTQDDPNRAIGEAIGVALKAADRTQGWLGAEVARAEGAASPFTQPTVSGWVGGAPLPPARVFLIEDLLGCPGEISTAGGYVRTDGVPWSVPAAIKADDSLSASAKAILLGAYRSARKASVDDA